MFSSSIIFEIRGSQQRAVKCNDFLYDLLNKDFICLVNHLVVKQHLTTTCRHSFLSKSQTFKRRISGLSTEILNYKRNCEKSL